jgi:hypothetical protein
MMDEDKSKSGDTTPSQVAPNGDAFVMEVGENDVLMGRGAPSTEFEGNMRFRQLVLERRDEYMNVDKRKEKHRIAKEIINTVKGRKGRFLQRTSSGPDADSLVRPRQGVAWKVVEDSPSLFVKVKQLMRDVGPEAKERRHVRRQLRRLEEEEDAPAPGPPLPPASIYMSNVAQASPQVSGHSFPHHLSSLLQQNHQLSSVIHHEQRQREASMSTLLQSILGQSMQSSALTIAPPRAPPATTAEQLLLAQLLQQQRQQQQQQPNLQQFPPPAAPSSFDLQGLMGRFTQAPPAPAPSQQAVDPRVLGLLASLLHPNAAAGQHGRPPPGPSSG